MDKERLARVYSYVLQATGDPGKAAQAMKMAAERAGATSGIMSRVQNDPYGSFGPQAEARNPDPANLSFSQYNDPRVNPGAPIVDFGKQALGMVTPYELGGGAAQMATGDVMGGAARTAMSFPFFPKIKLRGRRKEIPEYPATDPRSPDYGQTMRQIQGNKIMESDRAAMDRYLMEQYLADQARQQSRRSDRAGAYSDPIIDPEPTASQTSSSGQAYSDPVIDPVFFGGSAPASKNSPPAYQDPVINPEDVDNLAGAAKPPRDSTGYRDPRPGKDNQSASTKPSTAERRKILEYATNKWNTEAGRGVPDITYDEVAEMVPGKDPKLIMEVLDKIKAKMRRAGSKRRFRAQVNAGDIVPLVGVTVGAGAAGASFFPDE